MAKLTQFQTKAHEVKSVVAKNDGKLPDAYDQVALDNNEKLKSNIVSSMKESVQNLSGMRSGGANKRPVDISLADYAKEMWGFAPGENGSAENFFKALGLDYGKTTIDYLLTQGDMNEGYRWLVPEVVREALRLGLRKSALWPNIVSREENVEQPKVNMPFINMSDATPSKLGEAETIPTGMLSFGSQSISLQKVGVGLKMSDEVIQYTSLALLSIFLQDLGQKMNLALDVMAIDVLINGDGNANAAPVIGVNNTTTGLTYADLLRAWIRMGLLGRQPQSMLSNENMAITALSLPEFTNSQTLLAGIQPKILKPRTPIPTPNNIDIHGAMPVSNQIMLIDNTGALIKFNSKALSLENERIVERQISGTYATMTTGFANLFRDARIIIDQSIAYSGNGFPTWMDAGAVQAAGAFRAL